MKFFTFRLPTKKYIHKYLTAIHGETIPAVMETDIGFVVLSTLTSKLDGKVCRGYNNQWKDPYQATLTFTIPFHFFYLTKKEISVYTCILLNRYFENKFEDALCQHVEKEMAMGKKLKQAIEDFAGLYAIEVEEDISFEALKKMEYRSRKKNEELILRRLSSPKTLFSNPAA